MATAKEWIEAQPIGIKDRSKNGYSLMHWAAAEGQIEAMKFLMTLGINLDIGINTHDLSNPCENAQPIHVAAEKGQIEVLKWLQGQGISLKSRTGQARRSRSDVQPMHFAARTNQVATMSYLQTKGISVDVKDSHKGQPLHYAAASGALLSVKWLVDNGADINAKDNGGITPLQDAIDNTQLDVVEYLTSKGAKKGGKGGCLGGCYIATSVYGSYDAPEVWVLRRFRDNILANSLAGRIFIRSYYAISPAIVRHFGKNRLFRGLGRRTLDLLVAVMRKHGL